MWQAVQCHGALAHTHVAAPGHRVGGRAADRQLVVRRGVVRAVRIRLQGQRERGRSIKFAFKGMTEMLLNAVAVGEIMLVMSMVSAKTNRGHTS